MLVCGGTQAVFPFLHSEDIEVHAASAAFPELFVVGEFGIGYRLVSEFGVDFSLLRGRWLSQRFWHPGISLSTAQNISLLIDLAIPPLEGGINDQT